MLQLDINVILHDSQSLNRLVLRYFGSRTSKMSDYRSKAEQFTSLKMMRLDTISLALMPIFARGATPGADSSTDINGSRQL